MNWIYLLLMMFFLLSPQSIDRGPSIQARAEQTVKDFLGQYGQYMAVYFDDVDTVFSLLEEDSVYIRFSRRAQAYQDSTILFSQRDMIKADSFFRMYKKMNLEKDSMRIHYQRRPIGYLLIHHYQLDGQPWTDSFMIDFNFSHIFKVKQTIE